MIKSDVVTVNAVSFESRISRCAPIAHIMMSPAKRIRLAGDSHRRRPLAWMGGLAISSVAHRPVSFVRTIEFPALKQTKEQTVLTHAPITTQSGRGELFNAIPVEIHAQRHRTSIHLYIHLNGQ